MATERSTLKSETKVGVPVAEKIKEAIKILSDNRTAHHNYSLSDRMEAGLVLSGTEVKAARDGKIQLKDAFGEVIGNEAWLCNAHIGQYSHGNIMNHEPVRKRKLLLHREEISRVQKATREKGLTLVPTKLYLKHGLIKVELAIGRGKKLHDKRESERERERRDEARAGLRRKNKD